jgi:hypothetical protein
MNVPQPPDVRKKHDLEHNGISKLGGAAASGRFYSPLALGAQPVCSLTALPPAHALRIALTDIGMQGQLVTPECGTYYQQGGQRGSGGGPIWGVSAAQCGGASRRGFRQRRYGRLVGCLEGCWRRCDLDLCFFGIHLVSCRPSSRGV